MSSFPLLFELGSLPTTRDIANAVKTGGTAALTEADRRADQARYQEVTCRSAINRVKGMPFEWTLNPYRGCTPTVDEDAWRRLEPGTAHPLQRLRAVRALVDAGINCGVLMNPIVPGFSSSRAKLERTVKAIAEHGARFVGCNVMFLEDGTRAHFMTFLEREFPAWLPRFEQLYEKKYAPANCRKQVQGMVRVLQDRYGLRTRQKADAEHPSAAAPHQSEQVGFSF